MVILKDLAGLKPGPFSHPVLLAQGLHGPVPESERPGLAPVAPFCLSHQPVHREGM